MKDFIKYLRQIAKKYIGSKYFKAPTNSLGIVNVKIGESDWLRMIDLVYYSFLGRKPAEAEYSNWISHMYREEPVRSLIDDICASEEATNHLNTLSQLDVSKSNKSTSETSDIVYSIDQPDWWSVIDLCYQLFLGRTPNDDEKNMWDWPRKEPEPIRTLVAYIKGSEEAQQRRQGKAVLPDKSDGTFVQTAYRIISGRGPIATEIAHWDISLRSGHVSRESILTQLINAKVNSETENAHSNDPNLMTILGTTRIVSKIEWDQLGEKQKSSNTNVAHGAVNRFIYLRKPEPRVGIVTSLYGGGRYIEQFITNMLEQTIFDQCELIIIDAASPEGEYDLVRDVIAPHRNIIYERLDQRIGIYPAWNLAVKRSTAPYLTNANLDDLRRADSFEIQAATLDALPFVDVVYQDFLLSFDDNIAFTEIARRDLCSKLPVITANNLMSFNSPHNAPMWRRTLHDEIGMFNETFKSAGDYEFWCRCAAAGKIFYKSNDPHVSYYVNPTGLSTKAETAGIAEAHRIFNEQGPRLISAHMTNSIEDFQLECATAIISGDVRSRYEIANNALLDLSIRRDAKTLEEVL